MRHLPLLALAAVMSTPALAVGRLADVTVIDRDTGETLPTYYHRGEQWVAGRPGAHYAIQIRSQHSQRLLAVTSVDGVNVVTGETAAVDQRGYVFDPWSGYGIAGWRKSDSEIAAFTFTSIPKSYAARTGRAANVGVIGVALFRESAPPMLQVAPQSRYREEAEAGSAAAPTARAESKAANEAADMASAGALARAPAPAPSLGTGHGRREESVVSQVAFERERPQPNEVIRIRYDSRENLVAMGVIRTPAPRPRQLDPFPNSPRLGYVPDP
jgi:hypothetical protein